MSATTVSLFCGAGGESAGKELAFRDLGIHTVDMLSHAVNHWGLAVAVHGQNFPHIHVHQEDITEVTAADFGLSQIDMLWASPSCVHHSRARGGKPKDDQQRSHADEVVDRWLRVANVDVLLVENVPEFAEWGPLDDNCQPIKERKAEFFNRFTGKLKTLGYRFEWRILCAADYGDPTIRRRFFLQAIKDGRPIEWPEPTHRDPRKPADMFNAHLPAWRTAAECIDWTIPCPSIFDRKRPLAPATMARIAEGIKRYVLESKKPYIVNLTHGGRLESVEEPFKTIVVPSLVGVGGRAGQSGPRGVEDPMATATTKADTAVVATTMISLRGTSPEQLKASAGSVDAPLPTVSAGGIHAGVVSAFLAKHYSGVVGQEIEKPLGTVTAVDHHSLCAATMIQTGFGEREGQRPRALDLEAPLGTVVAGGAKHALVAAFIQQYYSTGGQHQAPQDPLHAVTTVARHALCTVEIEGETFEIVDIGMRMLEPKELAAAMGFPENFKWQDAEGKPLTKRDQIKMIGNACPVNTVCALIKTVVSQRSEVFRIRDGVA